MDNYYDILQVSSDANEGEIKKAYSKLLRKYPPEKCPEEFKRIREAYETLRDSKTRSEYDALSKYGNEIEEHDKIGWEAIENKDYKKAIREYKKILLIQPSLAFARNRLGLALLYNGNVDEAIAQFEKLVGDYPANSVYMYNVGIAYRDKGLLNKAEEALLKAHELDKINSDVVLSLSGLYTDQKLHDKAIALLRRVINENHNDNFENFIYYFEMVTVNLFAGKLEMAEKVIDEIENIIPEDEETKQFVAWKFGKLAYELFEYEHYNLAERISKRAMAFDPSNKDIKELHDDALKLKRAYEQLDKLIDDKRIIGPVKGPVLYYLNYDEKDKEKHEKDVEANFDALQSYIDNDPQTLINSLSIFVKEYYELYEYKKEVYEKLSSLANESRNKNYSGTTPNSTTNPRPASTSSSSSSCFVATAAFGTPWAEEINVLRRWRDQILVHSIQGKRFVDFYYVVGPYMAKVVEKSALLKSIVRKIIYKIIKIVQGKYDI